MQIFWRDPEAPNPIARGFVDACDDFAHRLTRAASLLERARPTIDFACTIDAGVGFGDAAPFAREVAPILLQARAARTGKRVRGRIEDELRTTEGRVIALALLPQGHMRLDGFLLDHPGYHLGRAVGGVAN